MLKDITLGQYFPGDSFIHRLDPRTKILGMAAYIAVIFCIKGFAGYGILAVFTLFLTGGRTLWKWGFLTVTYEGLRLAVFMVLRLFFLVFGTSLLTLTTSPIALTDGLEYLMSPLKRIGVPAHELAMMMTIALRFVPTLLEETDKIIKAQTARGADFETGNVIRRAKAMIPILIPLFVSAFRRADELATAMECRCYRGGEGRTRLRELKMGAVDAAGAAAFAAFAALITVANIFWI